ncbi:hypothetical protein H9P43_001032 [Blastocladiella emersonii ATCC 22665]|nr:hypothetical protein H9P43_001032 [Blastocladiella emersonii ATCC 22665]
MDAAPGDLDDHQRPLEQSSNGHDHLVPLVAAEHGDEAEQPQKKLSLESDESAPLGAADPPPDGGRDAVLVVVSSFLVNFVTLGIQYSYGIWQRFLPGSTEIADGRATSAAVALVGSTSFGVMYLIGAPAGRLADSYGYRRMLLIGTVILVGGHLIAAALATEVWHLILTQGIVVGVGCAVSYFPAVAVIAQWWLERRSFVTGIAVAGAGVGGLAFANGTEVLLRSLGVRWTLAITGFVAGAFQLAAAAMLRVRVVPHPPRSLRDVLASAFDLTPFKELKGAGALMLGVFLSPFGYLIPYYFVPAYCVKQGLPSATGTSMLTVINVASITGRIAMGRAADRLGNVNLYLFSTFSAAATCLALWLPAGDSLVLLYAFAAAFGFFCGGLASLMPSVTAQLFGVRALAASIGAVYSAEAVGHLAGPPLAALLITSADPAPALPAGTYSWVILYAVAFCGAAAVCLGWLRYAVLDRRFFAKV